MKTGHYLGTTNWEWLLTVPLSKIKSRGVAPSFYIKMMKRRTLQASSLKHSIQKGTLFALGKMNLFRLGKGKFPLPPILIRSNNIWFKSFWNFLVLHIQYFTILILQNKISPVLYTFVENELKMFCCISWCHTNVDTLWLQKQPSAAILKMIFLNENIFHRHLEGVLFVYIY